MLDQLVAAGSAVPVQTQDGDAQGGAGGLAGGQEGETPRESRDGSILQVQIVGVTLPAAQSSKNTDEGAKIPQ